MANETPISPLGQLPKTLVWVGRSLLLVPEAALVAALLCIALARPDLALAPLLAVLLMACFIVRVVALHAARRALERGRYRAADLLVRLALLLFPWSADGLALHGALALALGQTDLAETQLRRAIALLPNQPAFHTALSGALLDQRHPAAAAAAARQALALDSDCALAHLYLAEAEQAAGAQTAQVEARFRSGLAISKLPEVTAALQCGLAGHLLAERRVAEAMLALHSAEALLPHCAVQRQAELRFHLAELLSEQGLSERAREHFRDVEALDPHGRYAAAAWRGARLG